MYLRLSIFISVDANKKNNKCHIDETIGDMLMNDIYIYVPRPPIFISVDAESE